MASGRRARGISAASAIRAFGRLGFQVHHVTGSHYILRHQDERRVTIPYHGTLKPGLVLNQLKTVGVSWEEFQEVL
ncbi:MAG: addiction module toxin, HicA family [Dehalococcoidia bacterium]|nr:addiction module toxin, HicA family [Dehalococcoidia bacterium]